MRPSAEPELTRSNDPNVPNVPNELKLSLLLIVTIVFVWLNVIFATRMLALDKDFGTFRDSAVAFLGGQDMYVGGKNLNPPHFMLVMLPLARVSAAAGWIVWLIAGCAGLVASIWMVIRTVSPRLTPWQMWTLVAVALSFSGTAGGLITGQVAWLLMVPFTVAWLDARRGRWTAAGAWLGVCASLKVFALIFLPYLLVTRRWKAAASMIVVIATLTGAGLAVFGAQSYRSWIDTLGSVSWAFLPLNASIEGFLGRTLAMATVVERPYEPLLIADWLIRPLWLGASAVIGLITFITVAALSHPRTLAPAFAELRRGKPSHRDLDRAFLLLALAALLISPLGWIYYGWLFAGPALAVALDWSEARSKRVLIWAIIAGVCWPLPAALLLQPSAMATVTFGSIYFWSLMTMWTALVVEMWPR